MEWISKVPDYFQLILVTIILCFHKLVHLGCCILYAPLHKFWFWSLNLFITLSLSIFSVCHWSELWNLLLPQQPCQGDFRIVWHDFEFDQGKLLCICLHLSLPLNLYFFSILTPRIDQSFVLVVEWFQIYWLLTMIIRNIGCSLLRLILIHLIYGLAGFQISLCIL